MTKEELEYKAKIKKHITREEKRKGKMFGNQKLTLNGQELKQNNRMYKKFRQKTK